MSDPWSHGRTCEAALRAERKKWNPDIVDIEGMVKLFGASHYLETLVSGDHETERCIYCGEMWALWPEDDV